jgi:type IV secretion system protein VirD4
MIKNLTYMVASIITIVILIVALYIVGLLSIAEYNTLDYIGDHVVNLDKLSDGIDIVFKNADTVHNESKNGTTMIKNGLFSVFTPVNIIEWVTLIVFILIIAALIKLWVYIYLYKDYIPLYLQRGGRVIDEKGSHGTANWLDKNLLKKYLSKNYISLKEGTPLGTINNPEGKNIEAIRKEMITTPDNPRFNDNIIVFAPPGEGKTFSFVFTTIMNLLRTKDEYRASFILNDSKGDVYKKIGKYLREVEGYNTFLFNLLSPKNSDRINILDWVDSEKEAMVAVNVILKNTDNGQDKASTNEFWEIAEEALFTATLLLFKFELKTKVNLAIIFDFFSQNSWEEINKVMMIVENNRPCKRIFNTFLKIEDPKIRGNIVFGLSIRLKIFALDEIRELTSCTDIDIYKLKKEETAMFFCIPDTNKTMGYLVSLVKAMMAERLIPWIDDSEKKAIVNRKIVQIDDEIANTGTIPQYPEWINSFRSRKWILIPIFQNLKQTEEMFGENWLSVYGACHTKIFIGINDPETAEFVSEELGIQSIRVMTKFKEAGITNMLTDERWSQADQKRNLMNPDELRVLDINKQIVIRRGCQPMLLYKVGWDKYKKEYKKAINMPESVFNYKKDSKNEKKIDNSIPSTVIDFSRKSIETIQGEKEKSNSDMPINMSDLEDGSF